MQLKTSFFNKTIYKKNLTRFAPVWGLYTLCLVMGVALLYVNGGTMKQFHFANNYVYDLYYLMAGVNLVYALIVAQLLFGDLFSSRMCNMLHAFPVRREAWFFTNIASGLTFSVLPTGVMTLVAAPLMLGSMFENAVALPFLVFLAANLEFLCFFGMAAFAAMCTANRFTMLAGYGLMNAGALIGYWLVDTVYTSLLYGVITPTALMWNLTPMYHTSEFQFVEAQFSLWELHDLYGDKLDGVMVTWSLTDNWWHLWAIAGVGILFLLVALVLYRKRNLECAGDAVAFHWLVPVFEVLCAVFVATVTQYSLENMLNMRDLSRWILFFGLVVGWFVAKMLVERSARVFRLSNWKGLILLAAAFGITLGLTRFDVLGIEDYIPEASKVKSVQFGTDWTSYRKFESPKDIEAMLQLHGAALEERSEDFGTFLQGYDGSWVKFVDTNDHLYDKNDETLPITRVCRINLSYELDNGKIVKRRYNVWVDSEAGGIVRNYLNTWEELNPVYEDAQGEYTRLERALENFENFEAVYQSFPLPEICYDKEAALDLLKAIDRDLQEGNMAQHPYFHTGIFRYADEYMEEGYAETDSLSISITSRKTSWHISIYPDAVHTIRWLQNHGLLDWEVRQGKSFRW